MGLLDDAIREHLDLKRRRGADPAEVERAEQEALGPVRRAPERVPGDGLDHPAGLESEPDFEPLEEDERPLLEEHDFGPGAAEPLPDGLHPTEVHQYADLGEIDDPAAEEGSWSYEVGADEKEPPPPVRSEAPVTPPPAAAEPVAPEPATPEPRPVAPSPPPPDPADYAGGETVEYDVPESLGAEPRPRVASGEQEFESDAAPGAEPGVPGDDDVLEETPEFLQDTPEHDRLWFEQRPPKDFDFDG